MDQKQTRIFLIGDGSPHIEAWVKALTERGHSVQIADPRPAISYGQDINITILTDDLNTLPNVFVEVAMKQADVIINAGPVMRSNPPNLRDKIFNAFDHLISKTARLASYDAEDHTGKLDRLLGAVHGTPKKVIHISEIVAHRHAEDPHLRAKGRDEENVMATDAEWFILRCSPSTLPPMGLAEIVMDCIDGHVPSRHVYDADAFATKNVQPFPSAVKVFVP